MNNEEILAYVTGHPAGRVKIVVADIDGVLRGKYISTEKFLSAIQTDLGFCDVIFGWDMADQAYDNNTYTGWHTGYPDAKTKLVLESFRKIPWENGLPFFMGQLVTAEGQPLTI